MSPTDSMITAELNRRTFLVSAAAFAGGMSLSLLAPEQARTTINNSTPFQSARGTELSPWLAITPDDTVIIRTPTGEVGNGSMTQVAMNVSEELCCDWSKVRIESASVLRDYNENGIYSKGGQSFFCGHGTDHTRMQYALQVGASARERLKAAAAARWNVPLTEIEARNSVLTHTTTRRTLRYGDVAAQAVNIKLATEPALKPRTEWTLLGKASPAKLNLPEVVRGTATYGIDVKLPGMVYAALRQSPVHGGKLKSHDPSTVLKMPGVRAVVVVDPAKTKGSPLKSKAPYGLPDSAMQSGVAVLADHYWQAKKALDALPVEWDSGAGEAWKSTEQLYDAVCAVLDQPGAKISRKAGDIAAVTAASTVEATYRTPYCDQTPIEPLNGTALVTADKVEVWHPCQDPQQALWVAVDETGLAPEHIDIHQTYIGGAFGRRVLGNDMRMVIAIAREYPNVPVKVIWLREEMMRQGRYRTMIASRFKAGLDTQGMPQSLISNLCTTGLMLPHGYSDSPYVVSGVIPNVQVANSTFPGHLLTGAYRGPCYNSHVFMVETFIDECAVAAGIDPLEYRLKLLDNWDPAWTQCLKIASEKSGWGKPLPKGQGRGIAISSWPMAGMRQTGNAGSIVCTAVHVEVSRDGMLQVKTIDVSFDSGRVANRDAVAAQLEGGSIFGMNMTLNEELTIKDGAVVEGNFDQYPMLRMGDVTAKINIHFDALSGTDRFGMIGEAPVGPIGPAIGNAIFQATGKRLRTTPFRKHDLSWT